MKIIRDIVLSSSAPLNKNVAWIKPINSKEYKIFVFGLDSWIDILGKGRKGDTGDNIELKVIDGYIQYKASSSETWIKLISLDSLTNSISEELSNTINNIRNELLRIDGDLQFAINNIDFIKEQKVDKEYGKGLFTNNYTTLEKQQLATITQPTVFEWDGTTYKPISVPADFNKGAYPIVTSVFKQTNPIDNPTATMDDKVYHLFINDQRLLKGRISNEEICKIWFIKDEARMFALDTNRATIEETLLGIDPNKYITPETIKAATDEVIAIFQQYASKTELQSALSSVYNAAVAYTDKQVKDFATLPLYINPSAISTTQPTGVGTLIPLNLTTTEKLWFDIPYVIGADGVVDKNVYTLMLPFTSASTSRVTTCRAVWSITTEGVEKTIFDKEFFIENITGDDDFAADFIREYPEDIPYKSGDTARLRLYGRVSQGTDTANVLLGDANRTAVLIRAVPTSDSASKAYVDNAIKQAILDSWEGQY